MKNKLLFLFITLVFVLNLSVYVVAQETIGKEYEQTKTINKGYELAKLLPDSDVVVVFKAGEFFREVLPQVLSSNHQTLLTKIKDELNKVKAANRGLDLRDVENVVMGLKFNPDVKSKPCFPEGFPEFEGSALFQSRSKIDSKVPILMAKRKGKYHQEKIGNRTIYIVHEEKPSNKNKSKKSDLKTKKSKLKTSPFPYFAVASYSENTLVIGSPGHVKKTIGESQKVSTNILDLLNRKPGALITFGSYFPKGFLPYIDFGDIDKIVAAIDSIRQVQGSLNINEGNAFISVVMETSDAKNAKFLHDLLITGRFFLTTRFKKPSMKLNDSTEVELFEMIENSEVSRDGGKIMLNLKVKENAFEFLLSDLVREFFFSEEKDNSNNAASSCQ